MLQSQSESKKRAEQIYQSVQKDINSAEILADSLLKLPLQEDREILDFQTLHAFSLLVQHGATENENHLKEIKDSNKKKNSPLKGKWKEIQSLYGNYHQYIATIAAKKGGRGIGVPTNDALHHYKRLTEIHGNRFAHKSRQVVIDYVESYIEMKYMIEANDLNEESERILLNLVEAEYSKQKDNKGLLWPNGRVDQADKKRDELSQSFIEDRDESLIGSQQLMNNTPQNFYEEIDVDWYPDYLDNVPLPEEVNNIEKIFYHVPSQKVVEEQDNSDKTADYQQLCKNYAALPKYARDWAEETLKTLELAAWEAFAKKYSADFDIDFEVDMLNRHHPEVKQGVAEELKILLLKTPNPIINSSQSVDANQMKAFDLLLKRSAKNQHKRSFKTNPKYENDILRIIKMSNGDSWYNKPSKDWNNINHRYGSYLGYVASMVQVPGAEHFYSVAYGAYHTLMEIIQKRNKYANSNFSRELIDTYIDQLFEEESPEAMNILYLLLKEKLALDKQSSKKNSSKSDKPANLAATVFVERYEKDLCADYFTHLTDKSLDVEQRIRDLMRIKEWAPDIGEKICDRLRKVDDEDVREILVAYEQGPTPQYLTDNGDQHYVYHQKVAAKKQLDNSEEDDDEIYEIPDKEMTANTVGYQNYVKEPTPQYPTDDGYNHYTYHQNLTPTKQFDDNDEDDDELYADPNNMMNSVKGNTASGKMTVGEFGLHEDSENKSLGNRLLALEDHYEELEEFLQDGMQATKGDEVNVKAISNLVADAINNIEEAWQIDTLSKDDRRLLRDKGKELEEMIGKLIDQNLLKKHEYRGQIISDKEDAMFSNKRDDTNEIDGDFHQFNKNTL